MTASSPIAFPPAPTSAGSRPDWRPTAGRVPRLRYRAWPIAQGRYVLNLYVPAGTPPRKIAIGKRTYVIRAGTPRRIVVPTAGAPLVMFVDVQSSPLGGRVLGVKVRSVRFLDRRR